MRPAENPTQDTSKTEQESKQLRTHYNDLISKKPRTCLTGSHDSFPNPESATNYYQELTTLTHQFRKVFALLQTTATPDYITIIQAVIQKEFLLAAQDIAFVAKTKAETITYKTDAGTSTLQLTIRDIAKINATYSKSELDKHFNNVRYIYDRLFFLIAVLEDPHFVFLTQTQEGKDVFELQNVLSKYFPCVLLKPPHISNGLMFWQRVPNPHEEFVFHHVVRETSPIDLRSHLKVPLPDEVIKLILGLLRPLQLLAISIVNKQFWALANEESLWERWYDALTKVMIVLNPKLTEDSNAPKDIHYDVPVNMRLDPFFYQSQRAIYNEPPPKGQGLFQKAATDFSERKKIVKKVFLEKTTLFSPEAILTRAVESLTERGVTLTKTDMISAAYHFCLLLLNQRCLPRTFLYKGEKKGFKSVMDAIAKHLTQHSVCFYPPKEIYEFIKISTSDSKKDYSFIAEMEDSGETQEKGLTL